MATRAAPGSPPTSSEGSGAPARVTETARNLLEIDGCEPVARHPGERLDCDEGGSLKSLRPFSRLVYARSTDFFFALPSERFGRRV
jgi:hypothetical protein